MAANLLQRIRFLPFFEDIAFTNIELTLPVLEEEFAGLCKEIASNSVPVSSAWSSRIQNLLDRANQTKSSHPELAWRFARVAERFLLYAEDALYPGAADARADGLLKETDEKIKGWRGEAIKHLLAVPRPLPVWKVVKASKLLDEHHGRSTPRTNCLLPLAFRRGPRFQPSTVW